MCFPTLFQCSVRTCMWYSAQGLSPLAPISDWHPGSSWSTSCSHALHWSLHAGSPNGMQSCGSRVLSHVAEHFQKHCVCVWQKDMWNLVLLSYFATEQVEESPKSTSRWNWQGRRSCLKSIEGRLRHTDVLRDLPFKRSYWTFSRARHSVGHRDTVGRAKTPSLT